MKRRQVFLGYAVFYNNDPFPCSNNTVTRDKTYLKLHALRKLNSIDEVTWIEWGGRGSYGMNLLTRKRIDAAWTKRRYRRLTLRRVYAC